MAKLQTDLKWKTLFDVKKKDLENQGTEEGKEETKEDGKYDTQETNKKKAKGARQKGQTKEGLKTPKGQNNPEEDQRDTIKGKQGTQNERSLEEENDEAINDILREVENEPKG